jgi:hypothetical protein
MLAENGREVATLLVPKTILGFEEVKKQKIYMFTGSGFFQLEGFNDDFVDLQPPTKFGFQVD